MRYFQFAFFAINFFLLFFNNSFATSQLTKDRKASIIDISDADIGKNKRINVGLNKVIILRLPAVIQDVLVSDPNKTDVVMHSSNTIYLFGKDTGQANVILFGHDNKQVLNLDVSVARDVSYLESTLKRFIPDSKINVEMMSDTVVLHGIVRTIQDSQRAVELSDIFLSKSGSINHNYNGASNSSKKVVNLLNISGEDQVTLKVTIAEVRRDILKQIGFRHNIMSPASKTSSSFSGSLGDGGIGSFAVKSVLDRFSFESFLSSLERATAIRTLAEPTLTAISGQSASFRSGGERLYNTVNPQGVSNMTSHDYGVVLNFTPTVLSPGRIALRIQTEVSEPVLSVGSGDAPEFRVRKADTTVELPSGGTIVLAGLLKDDIQQMKSGIPLLSRIPILGALFRQNNFSREEAEIFIAATPYLVQPVPINDLSRPDDNYDVEDDTKSFFFNRVNKIYGTKEEIEKQNYKGAVGFIYK
ncbi:type II and III secretion system protein family protein [Candidatus Liberibacter brunswickensis]|uniref:type II and III secretion system protein family protein n=1 Tax=Candidatus Liberibacter brunswickensis TaxID=1968796 RepID=UPI002FE37033